MAVEFRLLGEIEVRVDGQRLPIRGLRQTGILAVLLVEANQPVSRDRLLDRVWASARPPAKPGNAVQTQITLLRRILTPCTPLTISWQANGYQLHVDENLVDLHRFRQLLDQARAAQDDHDVVRLFEEALGLWRGDPFTLLDMSWFAAQAAVLKRERYAALLDLTDARLRLGQHTALLADLTGQADEHPLDERLMGQLMLALYRAGRASDALARYHGLRERLADEFGTDPAPPLRELYQRILTPDGNLTVSVAAAAAPVVWHGVPPRNPFFTGRDDLLRHIHQQLRGTDTVMPLHGMGGVGKTQLALEYIHRHGADYGLVCWVDADNSAVATATLAALAAELGLPSDGSPDAVVARLWQALAQRRDWLLVYDNVDDPVTAARLRPPDTGRLLVTGRSPALIRLSGVVLEVAGFERHESVRLLTLRCASLSDAQARRIAAALEDLPLAIEQAGCFLDDSGLAVADYLELLAAHPARAGLADPPRARQPGLDSVVAAGRDRLTATCPPAADLLDQMSCLAPEALALTPRPTAERSGVSIGDAATTAEVARQLTRLALVRRIDNTIQVHRLVHALLRAGVAADGRAVATRAAARQLLGTAVVGDPNDPRTWSAYATLTPHALAVTDATDDRAGEPASFRALLIEIMRYLFAAAQYPDLGVLAARAHRLWAAALGPDHPDTLEAANSLGLAAFQLGDHAAARDRHHDNLERTTRVFGPDDRRTLRASSNLIVALFGLGEFAAARDRGRETLARRRQVLGDDDLNTLRAVNNLAASYNELGEFERARELYEEALERNRDIFGADHPNTLIVANNLGVTLFELGEYDAARQLGHDTLERRRRVFGVDNPHTLATATNVVEVLAATGDHEAAIDLGRHTVDRFAQVLGEDHPQTLVAAKHLVDALTAGGRYPAARSLGNDVLDRSRRTQGLDHPHTLEAAGSLMVAMTRCGDRAAAMALGTDTVARYQRVLGADHPHTVRAAQHLAAIREPAGEVPDVS